jgi:hypothetical protein
MVTSKVKPITRASKQRTRKQSRLNLKPGSQRHLITIKTNTTRRRIMPSLNKSQTVIRRSKQVLLLKRQKQKRITK